MNKIVRKLIMIMMINFFMLSLMSVTAQSDYDVSYSDPTDDVQLFTDEGEMMEVSGHADIDISVIKSSKPSIKQSIELELTVVGTIQNSEEISYMFSIMNAEESIYMVTYQNGNCTGFSVQDEFYTPDILVATGAGTNTLKVLIPVKNLGYVSEYDLAATTMELEEDPEAFNSYIDNAPDESLTWGDGSDGWDDDWVEPIILITEPAPGSTVYDKIHIMGVTMGPEYNISSVEVQLDSNSESGWAVASGSDAWETWSYDWETETVSDGKHIINARAFNGEEYYYDSITVYVDQISPVSPQTTNLSNLNVGDSFEYKITFGPNYLDMPDGATASGS
ncbi:MAG: hypothetical protein KAJ51_15110, partial [Thermoplasmata archaeon]|nr:hypothetical protein [Thermoplasmata archaeon]